jgi:hypothetical protein
MPFSMIRSCRILPVLLGALLAPAGASAQIVEATGSRALGMGGAFVAVANDSSATWWNPGALADGPFVDMALSRAVTTARDAGRRDRVAGFAIGTPPFGFSYYRLRLTEIRASAPTDDEGGVREEEQGAVPVRSLAASQVGATILQTLVSGVHAGTTLKYVRGTLRAGTGDAGAAASDLLDRGDALGGGDSEFKFDLDVGVLAAGGPVKAGLVVRNVRQPTFEAGPDEAAFRLPRQVRAGLAFDGARAGMLPVTVALDVDLRRYAVATGDRRVVAVGGEGWLFGRRLGVRAGGRVNTVGLEDRAATTGVSVAVRSGVFLDWHLVRGGTAEDEGWGLAARVSY